MNASKVKKAADMINALAHPLRMNILKVIDQQGTCNVGTIYELLHIEQSIASQHIRMLNRAGYVDLAKVGKKVFCTLVYDNIEKSINFANKLIR